GCDNYPPHKHDEINGWRAAHPRITLHFTPTSGSWLNMVEVFFSIITRQAIRRGTFRSVRELTEAIRGFIDGWNDRRHPFTWTKTADEILPMLGVNELQTRDTRCSSTFGGVASFEFARPPPSRTGGAPA